jgi:hypothetical protein
MTERKDVYALVDEGVVLSPRNPLERTIATFQPFNAARRNG